MMESVCQWTMRLNDIQCRQPSSSLILLAMATTNADTTRLGPDVNPMTLTHSARVTFSSNSSQHLTVTHQFLLVRARNEYGG